jgi:hypothetical protein
MVAIVGERPHRWRKRGAARLSRIGAFDAISGHRQLFHRTAQRALINLAIKDAIAGEESSCKMFLPRRTTAAHRVHQ